MIKCMIESVKCPECKKDIVKLINVQSGSQDFVMRVDKEGYTDYEMIEFSGDGKVNEWICPECNATLFTRESEAIAFLKGDKK